jgi:anti-sigma regulatory factor (Ser/Thr protein kinase)
VYESALNAALADAAATLLCCYDARRISPSAVAEARRTHPSVLVDGCRHTSAQYREPAEYLAERSRRPSAIDMTAVPWPGGEAAGLRDEVVGRAEDAGVANLDDLAVAVGEVATNAIVHGDGRRTAAVGTDGTDFVCDVSDEGPGPPDALAGYLPPDPWAGSGMGLWISRQLCDSVELWHGDGLTVARLRVRRNGSGPGRSRTQTAGPGRARRTGSPRRAPQDEGPRIGR